MNRRPRPGIPVGAVRDRATLRTALEERKQKMLMSGADYRESLRRYKPRVFVNGRQIESVADEPLLAPGIAATGVTYDFALRDEHRALMTARQGTSGRTVNRMLHINETSTDLLWKLEAVRLVCR
jgi:4-hydroxybutyryl-CoA dehydratase/vinylacetyl-CoA-Delta-isomerase